METNDFDVLLYIHTHGHLSYTTTVVLNPQRLIQRNIAVRFFIILLYSYFYFSIRFFSSLYAARLQHNTHLPRMNRYLHSSCCLCRRCLFMHRVCICVHLCPPAPRFAHAVWASVVEQQVLIRSLNPIHCIEFHPRDVVCVYVGVCGCVCVIPTHHLLYMYMYLCVVAYAQKASNNFQVKNDRDCR